MKVKKEPNGLKYSVCCMDETDLLSLRELIKSSNLPEKRNWQGVLSDIDEQIKPQKL